MIDQQILTIITGASPWVAAAITLIYGFRAAPGILDGWRRVEEARTDGKKQDFEAQQSIVSAGIKAVESAVKAMQDAQAQSREFYVQKLEDMRTGMHVLEERIDELEDQIEEKNERIEELERENTQLHREIDALRRRLDDGKQPKGAAKRKDAP